jgi:anti-sigma factor RsiW
VQHPQDLHLQAYVDGELAPQVAVPMEAHLQECPLCRNRVQAWQQLSVAIRSTCPPLSAFRSNGEFWARLAARCEVRQSPWALLPYLPPFLLGTTGIVAKLLLSFLLSLSVLTRLGVLPSPGPVMVNALSSLVTTPLVEAALLSRLGWSGSELARAIAQRWTSMGEPAQAGMVFGPALLFVGLLLLGALMLNGWWVLCWTGRTRFRDGG